MMEKQKNIFIATLMEVEANHKDITSVAGYDLLNGEAIGAMRACGVTVTDRERMIVRLARGKYQFPYNDGVGVKGFLKWIKDLRMALEKLWQQRNNNE